jgi:hypothetical protein
VGRHRKAGLTGPVPDLAVAAVGRGGLVLVVDAVIVVPERRELCFAGEEVEGGVVVIRRLVVGAPVGDDVGG